MKTATSTAIQATELHRWRIEEEQRIRESRKSEEGEKSRSEISEFDPHKLLSEEMKSIEDDGRISVSNNFVRYRKYTIEDIEEATANLSEAYKIGEGGYGPVFKCYLDHTAVAVKVLRPDATQGRSQFQQEV